MIQLILLAAGSARRFGADKLMYEIEGMPMIGHALGKLMELKGRYGWGVTVVTREGAVAEYSAGFGAEVVLNPEHEMGISTSIRRGLDGLEADTAVFFVADQPWLTSESIEGFVTGFISSGKRCGCVTHNGDTGNPCVFAAVLFDELRRLEGDKGGKRVIMRHMDDCFAYEIADVRELTDIDVKPQP